MMITPITSTSSFLAPSVLLSLAGYVCGLPTIISPTNDTIAEPPWMRDPDGRGTIGLLLSCVLTLGLCVWTAVHLNVDPCASHSQLFWRKCLWVVIGLFSPEIVLVSSYEQWQQARSLHRKVKRRVEPLSEEICSSTEIENASVLEKTSGIITKGWQNMQGIYRSFRYTEDEHLFGMTCSFFIVMGGTTIPKGRDGSQCTLTPEGFEYLLDVGVLKPSCVDTATILDKGKADFLAKFLVCVQAAWMILQCILRKMNDLPVTLIELNALFHVVIALFMYFFWWEKPLNIGEPIKVSMDPDLADILFALDVRRSLGITVRLSTDELPVFDAQRLQRNAPTIYAAIPILLPIYKTGFMNGSQEDNLAGGDRKWALWDLARAKRRLDKRTQGNIIMLLPGQSIEEPDKPIEEEVEGSEAGDSETGDSEMGEGEKGNIQTTLREIISEKRMDESQGQEAEPRQRARALVTGHEKQTVTLTESELEMLFSAAWALSSDKYERIKSDYEDYACGKGFLKKSRDDDFRVHRIKNLHFDMDIVLSEINGFNDPHIILSILNILYGAAHASVWNTHFPTPLEKWMWRWSCFMLLLPTIVTTAKWVTQQLPTKHMDYYVNRAVQILLHPVLVVYFCARVFVVVESFISVRSLPQGSYKTVEISEYWPHF
ncbi:hypothetical protein BZA05DRAFT_110858 [Tricharina praecox]|uniref:uncharacterized protein n=1 Tax=Tricharina praecox TaxID=43433 RepID=UPI002220C804|nr:uncharacterized protein BZA05DRAFT_110858 [Tricharina praecox]KAI5857960.1 hypothetical protein BZA05DRAFT_110858 [Tricharina praecox]